MLAGNVVSLLTPVIISPLLSLLLRSPKYDWLSMQQIRKGDDSDLAAPSDAEADSDSDKAAAAVSAAATTAQQDAEDQAKLRRAAKIARTLTVVLTLALLILWPMPMFGSNYIFSKGFFTGWVSVGILWLFCSAFCVGVYPLWEGRHTSARTIKAIFRDVTGRGGRPVTHGRPVLAEVQAVQEMEREKKVESADDVEVESR
jgi:hypothetical protein